MMENILIKIAQEAPNTVALLIVVLLFLRFLEKQNKRYDILEKEHEEARKVSRDVIIENTAALTRMVEVMRHCEIKHRL